MKRSFDILIAVLLLLPSVIVCLLCCILIALETGFPALLRQTRIGQNQKPFTLYKLRTMTTDTKAAASHEVGTATVTKVGQFLRKSKIDELPQLINVLKGEMSFVGPRPCLPNQQELIDARERNGVHDLRPGITGPAQIRGIDMSTPQLLANVDQTYITLSSLRFDLIMLAYTFTGSGRGDAAAKTLSD